MLNLPRSSQAQEIPSPTFKVSTKGNRQLVVRADWLSHQISDSDTTGYQFVYMQDKNERKHATIKLPYPQIPLLVQ